MPRLVVFTIMETMNKIEIIIEKSFLSKVIDTLDELDVLSATEVISKKLIADPMDLFQGKKIYKLLTFCSEQQKEKIVKKLFPIITQVGGLCIAYSIS